MEATIKGNRVVVTTKKYEATVDESEIVRVWDSVAGHYTVCHSLTHRQMKRIIGVARKLRG